MEKIFGKITELKFFGFDYFDFKGVKHLIARSAGQNKVVMKFMLKTLNQV